MEKEIEEVKKLIQEYISCNADFSEFYIRMCENELSSENESIELYLDMIPKAIAKFIFDNVIEFIEYCDNRQVRIINDIRDMFARQVEYAMMKMEKISESNVERKKYENEKYSYEQNINLGQIGYGIHITVVRELIKPLKQFMKENSQAVLLEMVANYRIACQIHGILERKIENQQEDKEETEKTLEELEQELQKLQKQDKRTMQQRDSSRLLRNAYRAELNKKVE